MFLLYTRTRERGADLVDNKAKEELTSLVAYNIIQLWCSNLAWDDLIALLVWVDKENSIEFSFDYGTLLIHLLCLFLFINSHAPLLVVPSYTSTNFLIKRKEKKKKMNNNLAVFGCVMTHELSDGGSVVLYSQPPKSEVSI